MSPLADRIAEALITLPPHVTPVIVFRVNNTCPHDTTDSPHGPLSMSSPITADPETEAAHLTVPTWRDYILAVGISYIDGPETNPDLWHPNVGAYVELAEVVNGRVVTPQVAACN